jgi:hypothetical protein
MTQKSGEAFVARAQVLASINQLSSHVPNCVLDFLGKEIRAHMAKEAEKAKQPKRHNREMIEAVSTDDDMSEVSELSGADVGDFGDDDESDVGFFVETGDMTDEDKNGEAAKGKEHPDKTTPSLMRRKSEEALDEMFKKSQGTASMDRSSSDEALGGIFNGSNEYGFSKTSDEFRLSTVSNHSGSMSSESMSKGGRRKSRSRSMGSAGSIVWGFNIEGKLPSVSRFECALLFVDISGTQLISRRCTSLFLQWMPS